jgi:hypothetical protein
MRQIYVNFRLLSSIILFQILFQTIIYAQDAGIINPSNNLYVHRYNYSTYIPNADNDMPVDGWSNTGSISNIKVYNNGSFQGYANNANSGSWDKMVGLDAGTNNIYINVRCNYAGCPLAGTDSPIRTVTYMKPYQNNDFYLTVNNSAGTIKVKWFKHTSTGTSGFYYRVYRNTVDNPATASIPGSVWTQSDEFIDATVTPGVQYYYWVVCASNSSGSNPSPFGESNNGMVTPLEPDLIIQSQSASLTNLAPNSTTNLSCSVYNNGTATTGGSSTLGYHLSTDTNLDGGDISLGSDAVGTLVNGQSSPQSETVTIPSSTTTGTYYILFSADNQSNITESDETNNISYVQVNIAPIVASVTPTSSNVNENSGTTNFSISNIGNGTLTWSAVSNDSWLTISSGEIGSGSGTIVIDYDANSSYSSRSGTITVTTNDPSNPTITLTVNQDAASCQNTWTPVPYPSNITQLTGIVKIDGVYAEAADYILAFVNGECRASAPIVMNSGVSYIATAVTVNGIETATLKILDNSTCSLVDICPDIQISPGATVGSGTTEFNAYTLLPIASVIINSNDLDNNIMTGDAVTFTVTPVNGGNSPTYQWKKNGSNVGTNSNTYTDNGLANSDQISCEMTTSDVCAAPSVVTSNIIMMSVLPVELTKFEGKNTPEGNLLKWSTASEYENKGFEVQKSNDKIMFETIDFVDGQGTTLEIQDYDYLDVNIKGDVTYYRLKQVDFDETFEYSDVVVIYHPSDDETLEFVTYPNPTNGQINVNAAFSTPLNDVRLEIVSIDGKVLKTIETGNGVTTIQRTLNLDQLASGNYFIVLRSESNLSVKRIVLTK